MWTRCEFAAAQDEEFFAMLPATAAVFVLRASAAGAEPYVSKTANLRRRMRRLLGVAPSTAQSAAPSAIQSAAQSAAQSASQSADLGAAQRANQGRRLNLRERVSALEYCEVGGEFEVGFELYRRMRKEFPEKYGGRLHLRPAPLLHLLVENPYPRVAVTLRIRSLRAGSAYFGPFASRAEAEQYANDSLDFFLLRRCTQELEPDPAFPGCVYSEMKMCLAPCFKGCSDARYAEESARVERYLESGGHSLVVEIGRARDEASERLEFEAAAAAHARLEKLKVVQSRIAGIVHRIDRLNGLLLQPSHLAGHIALFRIAGGMLDGPMAFDVSARGLNAEAKLAQAEDATGAGAGCAAAPGVSGHSASAHGVPMQSMEARILERLRQVEAAAPRSAQEWMEHLAILKRWYYRTNKVGEIFFEDEHGTLPMRRVVRAVGRVLKGEKPAGESSLYLHDWQMP